MRTRYEIFGPRPHADFQDSQPVADTLGVLVRYSNRALLMLVASNQTLIRATDESALLKEVCRLAVEVADYRRAWIGFVEPDGHKRMRPAAQAGFEPGYLESVTFTWAHEPHGPAGTILTGRPSIVRNMAEDLSLGPWRVGTQREYQSSIALPLISEGNMLGALCLHAAEAEAFDAEEVQILTELADDLAFGITVLRRRAEHDRDTEALYWRLEELNNVLASVSDYLWSAEVDANGAWSYRFCSPVVEKITGLPPEFYTAADNERWLSTLHPEDKARLREALGRVATRQSVSEEEEYRIVRPDGSVRWVRDRVTTAPLEGGRIRVDGVVSDITEGKYVEASSKRTSETKEIKEMLKEITGTLAELAGKPSLGSLPPELVKNLKNLSHREREIVQALLRNQRVAQIANSLCISPHTVRNHLASIFRKLGAASQSELLSLFRGLESSAISGLLGGR